MTTRDKSSSSSSSETSTREALAGAAVRPLNEKPLPKGDVLPWLKQAVLDYESGNFRPTAHYVLVFRGAAAEIERLRSAVREGRDPQEGAELIAAERERQKTAEGWTAERDDRHNDSEMTMAATCYIQSSWSPHLLHTVPPSPWPWDEEWWKPTHDAIRDLTKAGALIAAEIDRLQRLASPPAQAPNDQQEAQTCETCSGSGALVKFDEDEDTCPDCGGAGCYPIPAQAPKP